MTEHLKFRERLSIENLDQEGEDLRFGQVEINREKCKGCKYCVAVCPAAAIEVVEKKARMVQVLPMCMSCGNCGAICPEGAIEVTRYIEFYKYFRYLDRGPAERPRRF